MRADKEIIDLIEECVARNKIDVLAKLIQRLEEEYVEIARLSTDGNYNSGWTHTQVLDYLTFENRT